MAASPDRLAVDVAVPCSVLRLDVVVVRWADAVSSKLDENRMLATEKVFGLLIAAIAVQLCLTVSLQLVLSRI